MTEQRGSWFATLEPRLRDGLETVHTDLSAWVAALRDGDRETVGQTVRELLGLTLVGGAVLRAWAMVLSLVLVDELLEDGLDQVAATGASLTLVPQAALPAPVGPSWPSWGDHVARGMSLLVGGYALLSLRWGIGSEPAAWLLLANCLLPIADPALGIWVRLRGRSTRAGPTTDSTDTHAQD